MRQDNLAEEVHLQRMGSIPVTLLCMPARAAASQMIEPGRVMFNCSAAERNLCGDRDPATSSGKDGD
eukprot:6193795-Pleurochrysis_carterae.AAC.2